QTEIARAEQSDSTAEPPLPAQPLERGAAITLLIAKGIEPATRVEGAAYALHHDLVAAFGEDAREQATNGAAVVRRAHEHDRDRFGAARHVAVGQEHNAVGHPRGQPALDFDVARVRGWQASEAFDESRRERHLDLPERVARLCRLMDTLSQREALPWPALPLIRPFIRRRARQCRRRPNTSPMWSC